MLEHPGRYLRIILEETDTTQRELARAICVTTATISHLVTGRIAISNMMAIKLGHFFRMDPHVWGQYQLNWDLHLLASDKLFMQSLKLSERLPVSSVPLAFRSKNS